TATTSDAGLFVLHNVPVGTHGLSFFKANYEIADVQVVILSTDLGKTKTLSTQPRSFRRDSDTSRGMIQGQVLDENGTALDGALVKTDLKDPTTGQAYSATTTSVGMSKAGMFQLTVPALATYNLTISRQNYITYKLKSPVTNIVPQRLESVDIGSVQLAPTAPGGTGGDDDDGGGQPAPADAKFRPLKGRVVDSITKLGLNNVKVETEVGLEAFTAADYIHTGVFTFPLSPVGTYRLFATPPPHLGYDALDRGIEITIPPGSGTYELTQKIELKRSTEDVGRVFGQVLDALTAQPVNGATVELGGQITFTGRIGDHYGMYEFPRVMTSTISYYITVRKLGYIPQSQTVKVTTADQEYLQNFTLEPFTSDPDKGIVPGTVIEKDNFDPVAGATVWIETWDGEPLRHNTDDPPQPELGATGATVEAVTVVD
ncbi:MAG: carboxypeptidase regulatory-like domain-containing protein, partial [bacterium]|nr:carboxypeptidase regulatory-like domain-containing protein [bacterium]